MSSKQSYAVFGLGRYGRSVARELAAGGAFGAESSLAAVAGYLPVIILSLVNFKRKC